MESFVLRGGCKSRGSKGKQDFLSTRLLLRKDSQFFKEGIVCVWYKKSQFYGLSIPFVIL